MSIGGLILGVINIGIVAAVLLLLGLAVAWIATAFNQPLPAEMRKIYLLLVLLIVVYMVVALIFGLPSVRLLGTY